MTHNRHDLEYISSNPELAIRCKVPLWWARDGRHHFSSYRITRIDMRSNSQQKILTRSSNLDRHEICTRAVRGQQDAHQEHWCGAYTV